MIKCPIKVHNLLFIKRNAAAGQAAKPTVTSVESLSCQI
jgi:hypothetical protein